MDVKKCWCVQFEQYIKQISSYGGEISRKHNYLRYGFINKSIYHIVLCRQLKWKSWTPYVRVNLIFTPRMQQRFQECVINRFFSNCVMYSYWVLSFSIPSNSICLQLYIQTHKGVIERHHVQESFEISHVLFCI